jgi:hypothetical protein
MQANKSQKPGQPVKRRKPQDTADGVMELLITRLLRASEIQDFLIKQSPSAAALVVRIQPPHTV